MAKLTSNVPCTVCSVATSKYKCSTCLIPYCSLACYKSHKAAPAQPCERPPAPPVVPEATGKPAGSGVGAGKTDDGIPEEFRLGKEQLDALERSAGIKRMVLEKPQLHALLKEIDESEHPMRLIDAAMDNNPAFLSFAVSALSVVGDKIVLNKT
ncbi:hypothetical protein HK101_006892 [Irineochytrium annulatum]|nr:hypothetical protein HK101_006892 [Irineochytrium annulatum]